MTTQVSPADAYQALLAAGVDQADATTLTAVAGAESGYNLDALGDINLENAQWGPSAGIWQVRTLKAQTGKGGPRDIDAMSTLQGQANAAAEILHSQGLNAWTTFTKGGYRKFLGNITGGSTTPGAYGSASFADPSGDSGSTSSGDGGQDFFGLHLPTFGQVESGALDVVMIGAGLVLAIALLGIGAFALTRSATA